jgi:riboflavin synthase
MFTGIIESRGKVLFLKKEKANLRITVESSISEELKIGQSVAHNGVCLTVESNEKNKFIVTAIKETLRKTNLGLLKKGGLINLERSLRVGDRLDGHFVQGHVDTTAICKEIKKEKGSWLFTFGVRSWELGEKELVINKGSICINGVSLTVVKASELRTPNSKFYFSVAIIPHTFKHTNFGLLKKGDWVNIEFDVLGKYIQKIISK